MKTSVHDMMSSSLTKHTSLSFLSALLIRIMCPGSRPSIVRVSPLSWLRHVTMSQTWAHIWSRDHCPVSPLSLSEASSSSFLQSSRLRSQISILSLHTIWIECYILFRLSYLGKVFNWCGSHYISWSSFEILLQNFDSPCYTNFLMGTFGSPGWAGGLDWLHWQQYLLISSKSETPR